MRAWLRDACLLGCLAHARRCKPTMSGHHGCLSPQPPFCSTPRFREPAPYSRLHAPIYHKPHNGPVAHHRPRAHGCTTALLAQWASSPPSSPPSSLKINCKAAALSASACAIYTSARTANHTHITRDFCKAIRWGSCDAPRGHGPCREAKHPGGSTEGRAGLKALAPYSRGGWYCIRLITQ